MLFSSQFIRLPQVKEITCLSKSSIYRLIEEGDFPKQILLGACSVVWVKSYIEDWCAQKVNAALCWVVDKWKQHRSIAGFRTSCGTLLTKEHSICVRRRDTLSVLLPMGDRRGHSPSVVLLEGINFPLFTYRLLAPWDFKNSGGNFFEKTEYWSSKTYSGGLRDLSIYL